MIEPHDKKSILRGLFNSHGVSLVEGIIAVGVLSVVSLGIMTLSASLSQRQAVSNLEATLQEIKTSLQSAAMDQNAWIATIHDPANTSMSCLANSTACSPAGSYAFKLLNAAGSVVFDATQPSNGFDSTGAPCAAFSPSGNGACPIRFNLQWAANCPTASPCINPQIHVWALVTVASGNPQVDALYFDNANINFVRGVGTRAQLLIYENRANSGVGEGSCAPAGTWVTRQFNTIASDQFGNIVGATAMNLTLKAGTYRCHITAPAYMAEVTRILFTDGGTNNFYSSHGYAGNGRVLGVNSVESTGSTELSVDASFTIVNPTTFSLKQYCSSSAGGNFTLGIPVPEPGGSYNGVVYSRISCLRSI